jgi:uncharacterized protein YndB with AHSA1/START domain
MKTEVKEKPLQAEVSVSINATPAMVWKALTSPILIKKYLMGTHVESDWKVGSPITYEGEYQGKTYKDKGVIKKIEPEKILQSTYWSSIGGKEDKPENYNLVTYRLSDDHGKTLVTLTQDNIQSQKEKEHSIDSWKAVLDKLKQAVELSF